MFDADKCIYCRRYINRYKNRKIIFSCQMCFFSVEDSLDNSVVQRQSLSVVIYHRSSIFVSQRSQYFQLKMFLKEIVISYKYNYIFLKGSTKGQIISEWLFDVLNWTKNWTKIFLYFCPSQTKFLYWPKLVFRVTYSCQLVW